MSTGPDGTAPTTGSLTWGSCSKFDIAVTADVLSSARQSGLECAALDVPVDHAAPDGATTELALARLPATGSSSKRIGSLIVNPGGPGGSGLEFLASSGLAIPDDLRQRFDIVSFDPRGIASSSPLDCLTQTQRADLVDAESPDDPAQAQAQAADTERTIAEGCEADDAELFRNMGTDQVAGDLDDIREAVGDDELTFLGLSYGTRIAASYATQFPTRSAPSCSTGRSRRRGTSPSRRAVRSRASSGPSTTSCSCATPTRPVRSPPTPSASSPQSPTRSTRPP